MTVRLRALVASDRENWLRHRRALWPGTADARHRSQVDALLASASSVAVGAFADARHLVGFAEATLRRDHVNGCSTSPVAFLEGVFVDPASRRQGIGRLLVRAVEAWAREIGCAELASDADLRNAPSQRMHEALGFAETERVVFYREPLASLPDGIEP